MNKEDLSKLEIFLYKSGYTTTEVGEVLGLKTAKVSNDLKKEMVELRSASESRKKKKLNYLDFPIEIQTLFGLYKLNKELLNKYYQKNPAPRKPITLNRTSATSIYKDNDGRATIVELKELSDSIIKNIIHNTKLSDYELEEEIIKINVKNNQGKYIKITEGNQVSYQEQLKSLALGTIRDARLDIEYSYNNEFEDINFLNYLFNYISKLKDYVNKKFKNLYIDISIRKKKITNTFNIKMTLINKDNIG